MTWLDFDSGLNLPTVSPWAVEPEPPECICYGMMKSGTVGPWLCEVCGKVGAEEE